MALWNKNTCKNMIKFKQIQFYRKKKKKLK